MKILIAEDSAVSRMVLDRAVRALGHETLVASDGREAWALYERHGADAIISDWEMPGIDGLQLCRMVRGMPRGAYTYFFLLTAFDDRQHFIAGMQAGADDYLTKPLDREELQVRLLAAERVTSLHRQLARQNAELERLNEALKAEARRDPMTQLGNRLRLREDLEGLRREVVDGGIGITAALIDVDWFKSYNDRHGHLAGDDVLRAVAGAIARQCRRGDRAYRFGGEEFLVLLPATGLDAAAKVVERMRAAVEALALPHAQSPHGVVTVSCGLAHQPPGNEASLDALLREADAALYAAKEAGRNRVLAAGRPAPRAARAA